MNKEEKIIECECGCQKLVVDLFNWGNDDEDVGISFVSSYLGNKRSKLRALWKCLRNKETYYAEVLMSREKAINFFEKVLEMLKKEKGR